MSNATSTDLRVMPDELRSFAYETAKTLEIPDDEAELLARFLIDCDLRGVKTHGTRLLTRYAHEIRTDRLNPRPQVRCVNETPVSLVMDGDGGLGYFPAHRGTLRVIEKANEQGMAAVVCRNHGHIGAAGIYTRLTLDADLLAFATSGVQMRLEPGRDVYRAAGASPMSFSAPGHDGPALVMDAGVTHGLKGDTSHRDEVAVLDTHVVLRALGYGTICQAWGGLLADLPVDPPAEGRRYEAANQGMMLFAFKISLFADPEQFKRKIDLYTQRVHDLKPIPTTTGSFLPGGVEAQREEERRRLGIPLDDDHRRGLESLAAELGLSTPWAAGAAHGTGS